MNRHDLEELNNLDGMQSSLSSFGMFLLAGGSWVGVENVFNKEVFLWTPLMIVCALSVAFGVVCVLIAWKMRRLKTGKITRIFSEVEPYET